jgi:hypothetical protein
VAYRPSFPNRFLDIAQRSRANSHVEDIERQLRSVPHIVLFSA